LPPGFLQRIAIARAIAGRPRLLILDEANSSLDYASEHALSSGLVSFKGEITVLLITNRPSFAAIADRIFTLVEGKFFQLEKASLQMTPAASTSGHAA
jgi:ATP-binding cassette subfamily C protein LapB